jgi:hypothetical protein
MKRKIHFQASNEAARLAMSARRIFVWLPESGRRSSATVSKARCETTNVKQAILATVVAVVKKNPDLVTVLLKSEELSEATRVVYTGLNREYSFKSWEASLEVICSGDPKAKAGDKVPVIVDQDGKHR